MVAETSELRAAVAGIATAGSEGQQSVLGEDRQDDAHLIGILTDSLAALTGAAAPLKGARAAQLGMHVTTATPVRAPMVDMGLGCLVLGRIGCLT